MIAAPVGVVLGLVGKGWITLFGSLGCIILGNTIASFPNSYLVHFIKMYDEGITAKEATAIAQKHLQEKRDAGQNTQYFIYGIMSGVERKKRLDNIDPTHNSP
jgi:hypothetical protein